MKPKLLAGHMILMGIMAANVFTSAPVRAVMPVVDTTNLMQNITTATEAVAQTSKQIEQYRTQLQQYENMLQNTMAPSAYIWDQAQTTINKLLAAQNTLNYYKEQLGSLEAYLGKFQDVAYYRSSPCFNGLGGCTPAEKAAMEENRQLASESQKKANDALFQSINMQQKALADDARTLQQLQSKAQSATGQMESIGYANQLASQQANQLLQIRTLLLAQETVAAARAQALMDREAQETAADEHARSGSLTPGPARSW